MYFNAKLKVWINYRPAMWKLVITYAPILGATLIAGRLLLMSIMIGMIYLSGAVFVTIMALSAYRMVYASIWDWRINHIPLNRGLLSILRKRNCRVQCLRFKRARR